MEINRNDLLLVIDVQNDFCPGGNLAVPEGDTIIAGINALLPRFHHRIFTQDWHPAGHSSFASSHAGKAPLETVDMPYGPQTLWPDHCVQGSPGAEFHADLDTSFAQAIVRKGTRLEVDSYSAFMENDKRTSTGLAGLVANLGIKRIFCAGLATDFCVLYSATDSARLGIETCVVDDLCRAIDLDDSLNAAYGAMDMAGVGRVRAIDLV